VCFQTGAHVGRAGVVRERRIRHPGSPV